MTNFRSRIVHDQGGPGTPRHTREQGKSQIKKVINITQETTQKKN